MEIVQMCHNIRAGNHHRWYRLLVSGFATTPIARQTAGKLLENVSFYTGEASMSSSSRLTLYVRAAPVGHTKPYVSEDPLR